jgi:NADH-quinone oxidoreductase subunit L
MQHAWVIPAISLAAYGLYVFWGPSLGERSSYFGVAALGVDTLLAFDVLWRSAGGARVHVSAPWLTLGRTQVRMGFEVGRLEAVVLAMVCLVSWMIVIYSRGYMHGDDRYNRFFANVQLFVTGMLTMVVADNLLLFFMGWEIMGLCSYLLIGHWFRDWENTRAMNKAFLVTRIGDVGFMVGIWWIHSVTGSFAFDGAARALRAAHLAPGAYEAIALFLFLGAVGKSAQVPLQIWLPDAMAGPTPVSALIHAATMVAAGVFLVARAFPIFALSPAALVWVAAVGAVTAFLAATMATVQMDIKKVLAYSTVSQLGYMMLGLGAGSVFGGVFHLIGHAFFKALLFLGAGSVIHAAKTQNMHEMGGLARKMRATTVTFLVGTLALMGVFPFSGFWSKDTVMAAAARFPVLYWLAVAAAALTAYYMTRLVLLTFFGRPRDPHVYEHAHESPPVMTGPLWVLAVPAALLGAGVGFFHHMLGGAELDELPTQIASQVAMLAGVGAGAYFYLGERLERRRAAIRALRPAYVLFQQKWYFDHVGLGIAYATLGLSWFVAAWDRYVVDGLVNGAAWLTGWLGRQTRRMAVGSAQAYMITLLLAVAVGLIVLQAMGG